MLDIGWPELLVVAIILIVVVGPKDLPQMLRTFGKMTSRLRKTAGEFRAQFDEALRESELDDVRQTISDARKLNPMNSVRDALNPLKQAGNEIKSDLQNAVKADPVKGPATPIEEDDFKVGEPSKTLPSDPPDLKAEGEAAAAKPAAKAADTKKTTAKKPAATSKKPAATKKSPAKSTAAKAEKPATAASKAKSVSAAKTASKSSAKPGAAKSGSTARKPAAVKKPAAAKKTTTRKTGATKKTGDA